MIPREKNGFDFPVQDRLRVRLGRKPTAPGGMGTVWGVDAVESGGRPMAPDPAGSTSIFREHRAGSTRDEKAVVQIVPIVLIVTQ